MLVGISPLLSPELLSILYRMGHGDEIVFADAHFPGESLAHRLVRADGLKIADLLDAVLPLFVPDTYVTHPVTMMQAVKGDTLDASVLKRYREVIDRHWPKTAAPEHIDRFAFYERSKSAFAIVMTGETAKYGNIIVKKGVVPLENAT
ncbi:L-fucose mutarotase [candidate division KSB1 bacterium]|nr:L-fucose mutarotase [candidate division KSB1 bacterium]